MSHNLELHDQQSRAWIDLYQTPTALTRRALASGDPKAVYFAWLDARVEQDKPKLHPRASNAIRKRIMSSPEWRDYEWFASQVREHKAHIEAFLRDHPHARWCSN